MDISFLGHSCFKLRGKAGTLVTDPFDASVGIPFPTASADIVTVSHDHGDHNAASRVSGTKRRKEPFVIREPGEYEILGIAVTGIPSFHDDRSGAMRGKNTVVRIRMDGMSFVHMGDIGHGLSDAQLSEIGVVDVLFVPVGGYFTIDAKHAVEMVEAMEPSIVVPMHYRMPGYADAYRNLSTVDVFFKEIGKEAIEPQEKLSLSQDTIPNELSVVYLTASVHGDNER